MSDAELTIDEYQLVNLVASGTASQVWEVSAGGESLAMKLLLPEAHQDSAQKQVLKHEMRVGKSFSHPSFLNYHKIVVNKEHGYIIMDYFRAPSLKSQIGGDLLELHARFRKLVESLGLALGHMHEKGWLHRDIKPENVLFNRSSELRLIDFSLATRITGSLGKLVGGKLKVIQGTRSYIAPETLRKQRPTIQTDMYSLGVTLYECLTGRTPFKGKSPNDLLQQHLSVPPTPPSSFNSNVTKELDKFILRMLSKKPKDRHRDMNDLVAEFRSLKPFEEEVEDLKKRREEDRVSQEKHLGATLGTRLDSRTDAARSAEAADRGEVRKPAAAQKPAAKPAPKPAPQPQAQRAQQPPGPGQGGQQPPQGYPPGYPPQGYPMMPGYPMPAPGQYPQYPGQYPQYPGHFPQYPPQYAGQQGGFPPGAMPPPHAYPQQPGQPPQPGQQPGQPQPNQPSQPQRQQPQPGGQQPAGHPAASAPSAPATPATGPDASSGQAAEQGSPGQAPAPAQPSAGTASGQPTPAQVAAAAARLPINVNELGVPDPRQTPEVHPSQSDDDDDLPLMDELPDVV